ncbi:MAG: response regulator [Lachnospiraceae bacterium]|nr:response regulator [Lachnospiraceae bacterium]
MLWKVILVEDEDLLREGLMEFVDWEGLGFSIAGDADTGLKGLALAEEVHPDVVFTDIRMPGMDGIAMTEKIKAANPDTIFVILSGYDEFEYARQAVRLGVTDYLLKPVEPEQVEELMRKIALELQNRSQEQKDIEELQEIRRRSVKDMRSKWIFGALFETIPDEEMAEMERLLGWNPEEQFFLAGIVEWKDFSAQSINCDYLQMIELDQKFQEEFTNRLNKTLPDEPDEQIEQFHRNAGEYVIVQFDRNQEALLEKNRLLLEGMARRKVFEQEFLMSFGSPGAGKRGLCASWEEAGKTRENNYLENWNRRVKDKESENSRGEFRAIRYNPAPVLGAIRNGDESALRLEFKQFEQALVEEKIQSQIHLMYVVGGFYNEVVRLPEEIDLSFEETIGDPMDYYSKIVRKSQMTSVMEELLAVCLKVAKLFASSQASQVKVAYRRAVDYMEHEYSRSDLVMADVAQAAFISNTYLGIILKKETGKTFIEYMTELRIRHAKELLDGSEMKNYEVAEACGFSDATYFSTVFKKVCGMSPSAYRKRDR